MPLEAVISPVAGIDRRQGVTPQNYYSFRRIDRIMLLICCGASVAIGT